MNVSFSPQPSFNLQQEINEALKNSDPLLALETLVAAGVPIKKINQLGEDAIASSNSNIKLQDLKAWAKECDKEKRVLQILIRIFALDDPKEVQRDIDLFIKAGGKIKDVYGFIKENQTFENDDDRIKFLENVQAIGELEVSQKEMSSSNKTFKFIKTSSKSFKIEDACQEIFREFSSNVDLIKRAVETGHKEIACKLADAPTEDVDHFKALLDCLTNSNIKRLEALLALGYDANAANENGESLLHHAVQRGTFPAVDLLLHHGANVNQQDKSGWSPLHQAKNSSEDPDAQLEMWNKLVAAGADPTIRDLYQGTLCNTPLRQIIYHGTEESIRRMFYGYPKLIKAILNTPKSDRPLKIRENCVELLEPQGKNIEFFPTEIAFLIQDPVITEKMIARLDPQYLEEEIRIWRKKYPQCQSLRTVTESAVKPSKQHILRFGAITSTHVPDQADYDEKNTEKVKRLLQMLDKILLKENHPEGLKLEGDPGFQKGPKYKDYLKEPGDPGYRDLKNFRDVHGHTFTPLQLREKMQCLLKDIETRQCKPGTPPEENSEKLEHWYRYLESTLCEIIDIVELEDSYEASSKDPTPNASTIIEIALTGGNCGGWYMGESQKIKQQKKGFVTGLQEQLIGTLSSFHQGICESLIPRDHSQNTHFMNNILQVIDESAGIKEEDKSSRFYFLDHISPQERHINFISDYFWKTYHSTAIIDQLDEAIHITHKIEKELIIDWLKENVPVDFDIETIDRIQEELKKFQSSEEKLQYLPEAYQIAIPMPAPLNKQILDHFIAQSEGGEQYKQALTIVNSMRTMKDPSLMVKLIKQRYHIELNPKQSPEKQIQTHFLSKLPIEVQQQYQNATREIANVDYEKGSRILKEKHKFNAKPLPDVQKEINNWKASKFLESQISQEGRISREALVYMLGEMGILEPREDMVHTRPAHIRFL